MDQVEVEAIEKQLAEDRGRYYRGTVVGRTGGRQYKVVVLDAEPKALRGGRYLPTLVCAL